MLRLLKRSRMDRLFIYICLALFVCTASYIHYRSLTTPISGIVVTPNISSEWTISYIEDDSIASNLGIKPGDRIASFDGRPRPKLFIVDRQQILANTKKIEVLDEGEKQRTIIIHPSQKAMLENGFAFLMELFLVGIGWYSVRKRPSSHLFRRFFLMNVFIAFCIGYIFTDEIFLSFYLFPYCAIWLPYFMLSFYLLFAFRTIHSKFRFLLLGYRVYSMIISVYATFFILRQVSYPSWVSDLFNIALIFTLNLMAGITAFNWTRFDRIEKHQLFTLFISAFISLMPYMLLFALPYLLWEGSLVPAEYTLVGLVPISVTFTYLLVRRQILDLKLYIPRLMVQSLYYGTSLGLFLLAATWDKRGYAAILCALFGVMTFGYHKLLPRIRHQEDYKSENQKLRLTLQLTEKNSIRDIIRLIADMLQDRIEIQGLVILYLDSEAQPLVHSTGIYENEWTFGTTAKPDHDDWIRKDKFIQVQELSHGPDRRILGYLCLGPKSNQTPFSSSELSFVEKIGSHAIQLLLNAQQVIRLQHEYKQNKEQMEHHERPFYDFRTYSQMLNEAREAEKIRISYFLHDDLLQNLIFLSRDLEELHDTGRYETQRAATWLKCLYDSQRSIRSLSDHLYPHILDKGDLQEALRWLLRDMNREEEVAVTLHYEAPTPEPFPAYVKANLFRAVRELIVNVFKHAQATEMQVRIWLSQEFVYCSVTDNGKGFTDLSILLKSPSGGSRFGLLSVSDQIEHLGGTTDIDSIPGQGTSVTLRLPLY